MPLYLHPDMRVLRVSPGATAFLKAYTTTTAQAPCTAFLTREGRIVAVARQARVSDEETLLVVGRVVVEKLLTHLSKFLALCETKISPADEYAVYFNPSGATGGGDLVIPEKSGHWILSRDRSKSASMTLEAFTRFRVEHGIPEQGIDFRDEMPLCIDASWVNFEKGCYLGQEIVARVHYRGMPPKHLVVKCRPECSDEEFARMTSKVEIAGAVAGFVFV